MKEFRKVKSLKFLYEVSADGVVRNVKSKRVLTGQVAKNGYVRVGIENKCLGERRHCLVHRLVAEAWIPNPDDLPEVNHIDSDRRNNNVANLEWCTHSENMKHSYSKGINAEPLRRHSTETRKAVTNGVETFESISCAAKWMVVNGKAKTFRSAVHGISCCCNKKDGAVSAGGYHWDFV